MGQNAPCRTQASHLACPMHSVVILGASEDRNKFGNKALRAFQSRGYRVYPVHPKASKIEGVPVYNSITKVPERPHMVTAYLPPQILLSVLPDIASKGCDELWLNPGTESDEVLFQAKKLGLNVIQACSILAIGIEPETM